MSTWVNLAELPGEAPQHEYVACQDALHIVLDVASIDVETLVKDTNGTLPMFSDICLDALAYCGDTLSHHIRDIVLVFAPPACSPAFNLAIISTLSQELVLRLSLVQRHVHFVLLS